MLLINIIGFAVIVFIIWWFWLYKPTTSQVKNTLNHDAITITVEDGVYQPAHIAIAENKALQLNFIRKDDSPCAATVLFPELDISAELPLNKPFTITIPPMVKGKYVFHCQMKMYSGSVLVE